MKWKRFMNARNFMFLAAIAMLFGCDSPDPVATEQGFYLGSINIPDLAGWVGDSTIIAADATTGFFVISGLIANDLHVKWTSTDPSVFIIKNDDKATTQFPTLKFVGPGTAKLIVFVDDPRIDPNSVVHGDTSTVAVGAQGEFHISPQTLRLTVGETKDLKAAFYSSSGIETVNPKYKFQFTIGDGTVVSTTSPLFTDTHKDAAVVSLKGVAPGSVRVSIRGFLENDRNYLNAVLDDTARVIVTAAPVPSKVVLNLDRVSVFVGGTKNLSATVFDQNNNQMNVPVTWISGDGAIASVSSSGVVTGVGTGSGTSTSVNIAARAAPGVEATSVVTVYKQVASVAIDPAPFTMQVGLTHPFTATLKDGNGATIPREATRITWSVVDQSLATVDTTGRVTALAVGTTQVKATTAEGVSGTANLQIEPAPVVGTVVRVVVNPSTVTIPLAAATLQFTAKGYDAAGNEVATSGFRWLIDDSNLASVDGNGLVTLKRAGATTVRAFYGNAADAPNGSGALIITQ
jgi:hypothetical protein